MRLFRLLLPSLIVGTIVAAGSFPCCPSLPTAAKRVPAAQRHAAKKHAVKCTYAARRSAVRQHRAPHPARVRYLPVSPSALPRSRVLGPSARRFAAPVLVGMPDYGNQCDLRQTE